VLACALRVSTCCKARATCPAQSMAWDGALRVSARVRGCPSSLVSAVGVTAPLGANSRRGGRSRSLGQVTVCWRLVGVVPGRWRCCTCVLYGVWLRRYAAWPCPRVSATPRLPDHPVAVDPPDRGAGQAHGIKVEHPTGIFVPKPSSDVCCQSRIVSGLRFAVHWCPLASTGGGGRYSIGYSACDCGAGDRLLLVKKRVTFSS
jgi:hypothetical protein